MAYLVRSKSSQQAKRWLSSLYKPLFGDGPSARHGACLFAAVCFCVSVSQEEENIPLGGILCEKTVAWLLDQVVWMGKTPNGGPVGPDGPSGSVGSDRPPGSVGPSGRSGRMGRQVRSGLRVGRAAQVGRVARRSGVACDVGMPGRAKTNGLTGQHRWCSWSLRKVVIWHERRMLRALQEDAA